MVEREERPGLSAVRATPTTETNEVKRITRFGREVGENFRRHLKGL
jgi:hypothetical protein